MFISIAEKVFMKIKIFVIIIIIYKIYEKKNREPKQAALWR